MALIKTLVQGYKERESIHKEVDCTYYIINVVKGKKILQLDTYGTNERQDSGKTSQSIQFSPEAIVELKRILKKF